MRQDRLQLVGLAVVLVAAIVVVAVVVIVIVVFEEAEDACTSVSVVRRLEDLRALVCDDSMGGTEAPEVAIRERVAGPSAPAFVVSLRAVAVKAS